MISVQNFSAIFPRADAEGWVSAFDAQLSLYDINTPQREAMFIAQCGHESAGWSKFSENLNYSVNGLLSTFPKYFNPTSAAQYARKPEMIANRVYANRMGNGPEESGDGWKYRGRGPIQLTGSHNYSKFAMDTFDDWQIIVDNPQPVADNREVSLLSALWFWKVNNINSLADKGDVKIVTKKINGGYIGLEERQHLYSDLLNIIQ